MISTGCPVVLCGAVACTAMLAQSMLTFARQYQLTMKLTSRQDTAACSAWLAWRIPDDIWVT